MNKQIRDKNGNILPDTFVTRDGEIRGTHKKRKIKGKKKNGCRRGCS